MSTEQNKDYVPIPEGVKGLKIKIDDTAKDVKIAELNQKIGSQEEVIKSMLVRDKAELVNNAEKFVPHEPRPPTVGGDTAQLQTNVYHNIDFENSNILDLMKFKNPQEAISYLKVVASNPQSPDFKMANDMLSRAIKKTLSEGGVFELRGNNCRYERRGSYIIKTDKKAEFVKVEKDD